MKTAIAILFLFSLIGTAYAQGSLQGAWKVSEVTVTGGDNAGTNSAPQQSLYVFTGGYYSIMFVPGTDPRPENTPGEDGFSDEERVASFNTFVGNAGSYSTSGSTLKFNVTVARVPDFEGQMPEAEYSVDGDTAVITQTNDEGVITAVTLSRLE